MSQPEENWEQRVTALWDAMENYPANELLTRVEALAAELPPDDPRGLFERGSAQDSTGHPGCAIPLY